MARPVIPASRVPKPGPWIVRGEAEAGASHEIVILGIEPATADRQGGFPYFIRQDLVFTSGDCSLLLATGVKRLADAKLIAAAPEFADVLLGLLTKPLPDAP